MSKIDKKSSPTRKSYTFKHVSENLYKVIETGGYYALVKRGSKQIQVDFQDAMLFAENKICFGSVRLS